MSKTQKLNRRKFLKSAIAGAALGTTVAAGISVPAIASGKREWKMVMTWQKTLPGLGTGAMRLAKRITDLSGGEITVKPFAGGELVPPTGVFDAVSNGTAEMGHTAPYYWLSKSKGCAFFCAVPAGLTSYEQNAWLYFGGGQKLWDELYAEFGLKSFPAGNTGTQMGGWFNREINSIEDIKGLKMRMPGLAGEVLNRLGGSSQNIPPQELYSAMQNGVIDATEWVGPWNDIALGFHKVAKHYYGPGFHEGGPTLECMVNKKAYDDLTPELQKIIKVACATENQIMASEFYANNLKTFAVFKKKFKVVPKPMNPKVLSEFMKISKDVVAETATDSKITKKIYDSYSKFRKISIETANVTEYGFLEARNLNN